MTDLTLDDLASPESSEPEPEPESSSSSSEKGGEWIGRLMDRLDERGYLDAIIAQQFDVDMTDSNQNVDPTGSTDGENNTLDASSVAQFGKLVIDNVGDVSMSKVVQYAESNPQVVNQLISEAMGDKQE